MDMHPAGMPRLVGPAGAEFSPSDFSAQFRYLRGSVLPDTTPVNADLLSLRSHLQPLHLQSVSPNARSPLSPQPLRLKEEHGKAGSPRSPVSPQHLPPPDHPSLYLLQNPGITSSKRLGQSRATSVSYGQKADFDAKDDNGGSLTMVEVSEC